MNPKRIYVGVPVILMSIFAGFYLGKHFAKSSPAFIAKKLAQETTPVNYDLINPMVDCYYNRSLDMASLKTFKGKIEQYLDELRLSKKEIKVAYYFRDMNNGTSMGVNEDADFSPASLMKVPVMIALLKEAESNPGILSKRIRYIAKEMLREEESGSPKKDGEYYSVMELLEQSIQYSDNTATGMLILLMGTEKITKVEDALKMHALLNVDAGSNYMSVRAYANLFNTLYNGSYLNGKMSQKALELLSGSKYEKGIRAAIPPGIQIAQKYGKRDVYDMMNRKNTIQLHQFGLVYYPGKPFLVAVMTSGGNEEEKLKVIYDLTKISYDEVHRQMIELEKKNNIGTFLAHTGIASEGKLAHSVPGF